jgi:putative addiction module component (TIGR02574 family)
MKRTISFADVMELSIAQRIELVEDVWDTIAEIPEAIELTDEQKRVLDERIALYHKDPSQGAPWEEVRARIQSEAAISSPAAQSWSQ